MTDITRKRGDTYSEVFSLTSTATRKPLNLTGYSFKLTVDENKAPADASTKLFEIAGTILDAAGGKVEFAPSAPQADHVGSYFYDVQMIDGAGRIRTVVTGKFKFVQDITK